MVISKLILVSDIASSNIPSAVVKAVVSILLKSNVVSNSHCANIQFMVSTFCVSKFDKSILSIADASNTSDILVTLLVSKEDKSRAMLCGFDLSAHGQSAKESSHIL